MRVKLVAKCDKNGFIRPSDVSIADADTGEPIEYIRSVDFHADPDGTPILILKIFASEIEIVMKPEICIIQLPPGDHKPGPDQESST